MFRLTTPFLPEEGRCVHDDVHYLALWYNVATIWDHYTIAMYIADRPQVRHAYDMNATWNAVVGQRVMMESPREQGAEGPPETFIKQVKDALEHLYDLPYLQHHLLARAGELSTESSAEIAGQHLRRDLVAAIEALNPGEQVPFRAPHARLYNILVLHYMERVTIQEAAYQLSVSSRQALRNLRQGEKAVAEVLWARRSTPGPGEPNAIHLSSLQAEVAQLDTRPRLIELALLLQRARSAVEPLAVQRKVVLEVEALDEPVTLITDPVLAEQVLVSVLSHALGQAQPGTTLLKLAAEKDGASLIVRYAAALGVASSAPVNPVAAQLAGQLGWTVTEAQQAEDYQAVVLHMMGGCPTILIIDDNEGLVSLLQRYLTDQACRVVAAANGQEGLRLAGELVPDAIVLDVMMPGMPGWEVLQRLRNEAQTADVPVIVCSVINEPELAQALGATIFLAKPVRQIDVLDALRQLGVV